MGEEGSAYSEGDESPTEEGSPNDEEGPVADEAAVDDSNEVTDDAAEQPQPYGEEEDSDADDTGDDYVDSNVESEMNESGPNESQQWGDYTGTPDYESIENEFAKKTNEGG